MADKPKSKLRTVTVKFKTPLIDIEGKWEADETEQQASWELYVELITRIALEELKEEEGFLREALSSLHSLFAETREILKKYGPSIACPKGKGRLSFGYLAISVLNTAIRPILAYWHPVLSSYEMTRKQYTSIQEHESLWDRNKELRNKLSELRNTLKKYSFLLAKAAGVTPLTTRR